MKIDLLEGSLYAGDPDPTYAWMRENAPAYWDETNKLWGISRYPDVIAIEKDAQLWVSGQGYRPNLGADPSMIGQDDPRHLAQRRVISRGFTPRMVKRLESRVRSTVTGLIDAFVSEGQCDIVAGLAIPVPVITILELIGFDTDDWPTFARWAEVTNAGGGGPRYLTDESMEFVGLFFGRAMELAEMRRQEPRDDLMTAIVQAAAKGHVPRDDVAISNEALLLLNGGSDTTRHVIAGATQALLEHPEQLALLAREPKRIPVAVEEFIRWVTPILNMRRTATRATELHGETIRKGDEVLLMYSSANRDPEIFDDPQRFDVTRDPNPHIAFGFGTHFCLGASLARLELRVTFEELLRRLPDIRLAEGAKLEWIPNAFTRGLAALPVVF
jgi:cytochrome P450 family 142 subfamily A polypeptide 1